jgi:hypothetical protein
VAGASRDDRRRGGGAARLDPGIDPRHERRHPDAAVEEWVFACWFSDGSLGAVTGHRLLGRRSWYWAALVRPGEPLLHVSEWDAPVRSDPLIVKAHGLWAEHTCDAPMEQWTLANETYAAALDDPADALGRAYGTPSPVAFDLEWYATGAPTRRRDGYEQDGVVHGTIDLVGGPLQLSEAPARRWHRWGQGLDVLELPDAYAHTGMRAPFAFPDGSRADWVLTPDGWRSRSVHPG